MARRTAKGTETKTAHGQSVTVIDMPDEAMLLDELAARLEKAIRKKGDVDAYQMAERLDISLDAATSLLDKQADLRRISVHDPDKGRKVNVWRKR